MKDFALSILIKNDIGVLTRIFGLLFRRGYNIESLAVGPSEKIGYTRIIFVLFIDQAGIIRLIKQLEKLECVVHTENLTNLPSVECEVMLIKIRTTAKTRADILGIAENFKIQVLDYAKDSLILQIVGDSHKIALLEELFQSYEICELTKSGRILMTRDSEIEFSYETTEHPFLFLPEEFGLRFNEDFKIFAALIRRVKRQKEREEELEALKAKVEEAEEIALAEEARAKNSSIEIEDS
uniref:acetohydroxyacid synthase small subunit n=1 Tax=Haramonas pauciplastida TaxID=478668 RepID=UPI002113A151|nr:acetohydroxyacid synthase small subunit [Haramonas pauciplastida]UTE94934.1 acetohydroxyacid synthase small subunit [Haramonas pauciplastida]